MGMSYKDLAIKTLLSQKNIPLRASEIWDIAEKKGYDKLVDSDSQDPKKSLWVSLDQSMEKDEGIFIFSSDSKKYRLSTKCVRQYEKEKESKIEPPVRSEMVHESTYKEEIKRRPIDQNTRKLVWRKYMGINATEGKCYCCVERTIYFDDFEVGHNTAVANRGDNSLQNLRPICRPCNSGMKTMSIEEYKEEILGHKKKDMPIKIDIEERNNFVESSKINVTTKKMSLRELRNMLEDLPGRSEALRHTLEVYYHVLSGSMRSDATRLVAENKGIERSTVQYSYTGSLDKSTDDIDKLMRPENSNRFKKVLIDRFPECKDKINEFFNNI